MPMNQAEAQKIVDKMNKFGNALSIVKAAVDNISIEYPELVNQFSPLFGAATKATTLEEAKKIVEDAAKSTEGAKA